MTRAKKKVGQLPAVPREPNERERIAIAEARERQASLPARFGADVTLKGTRLEIKSRHTDREGLGAMLQDAFGTTSNAFVDRALTQLLDVLPSVASEDGSIEMTQPLVHAIALISAVAPQNELEAAMAIQMVAANEMALSTAGRARRAEFLPQFNSYTAASTKAMRAFALHVEALQKLRRGGEQVVRHVHVYEGGQAVVAEQVHVGGGHHAAALAGPPHALSATLPGSHAIGEVVPIACDEERPLPPSRREEHGRAG